MSRSLTGGRPAREKEINEIRKSTDCTTGKMIFTKLRDKNVALLVNSGGIAAVNGNGLKPRKRPNGNRIFKPAWNAFAATGSRTRPI